MPGVRTEMWSNSARAGGHTKGARSPGTRSGHVLQIHTPGTNSRHKLCVTQYRSHAALAPMADVPVIYQICPTSSECGPNSTCFAPSWQHLAKIELSSAAIVKIGTFPELTPNLAQMWPNFGRLGSTSTKCGQNWSEFRLNPAKFEMRHASGT